MMSQLPCFRCLFFSCQQQKNIKNGTAVTSLMFFLFREDFSEKMLHSTIYLWFHVQLVKKNLERYLLQGCYNPRRQTVCNCCDNSSTVSEGHTYNKNNDPGNTPATCKDNNLSRVHHVAKRDMAR